MRIHTLECSQLLLFDKVHRLTLILDRESILNELFKRSLVLHHLPGLVGLWGFNQMLVDD